MVSSGLPAPELSLFLFLLHLLFFYLLRLDTRVFDHVKKNLVVTRGRQIVTDAEDGRPIWGWADLPALRVV